MHSSFENNAAMYKINESTNLNSYFQFQLNETIHKMAIYFS